MLVRHYGVLFFQYLKKKIMWESSCGLMKNYWSLWFQDLQFVKTVTIIGVYIMYLFNVFVLFFLEHILDLMWMALDSQHCTGIKF